MLELSAIYQNGMVLQGDKPVRICGKAEGVETVCVSIQRKICRAEVRDGCWDAELGVLAYSDSETLEIVCGEEKRVYTDVAVGEVWLAGGQSNMEFSLCFDRNWKEESTAPRQADIRFYGVPEIAYPEALEERDYSRYGFWRKNDGAENLQHFSAVGYYFAKKLAAVTGHTVGVIGCYWGGTPACAWADPEALRGTPAQVWLNEYPQDLDEGEEARLLAAYKDSPMSDRTDLIGREMDIRLLTGMSREEQKELMADMPPIPADPNLRENMRLGFFQAPGRLYGTMLKTIAPYGVRGVIWYQGETDSLHAEVYDAAMGAVIRSWRALWGEKLPFYQVQLPSFGQWLGCDGENFPEIRRMQQKAAEENEDVYMAATMDCGMLWDIHPKDKRPVGERLAKLALVHTYEQPGKDVGSPGVADAAVEKGSVTLRMTYAENGLHLVEENTFLEKMLTLKVEGCGLPDFTAEVCRDQIILRHPEIRPGREIEIEFAVSGYCAVDIENAEGFTVRPFTVSCR